MAKKLEGAPLLNVKGSIKAGNYSDDDINRYVKDGRLDGMELIQDKILKDSAIILLFQDDTLDSTLIEGLVKERSLGDVAIKALGKSGKITKSSLFELIKQGYIDDGIIKGLADSNVYDKNELFSKNILSREKYFQLFNVPQSDRDELEKTSILQKIREDPHDYTYIRDIILLNHFTADELVSKGLLSNEKARELFPKKVIVDFGDWADVPDLKENRIDIFTLGIVGSGKSCLLGGTLHYTQEVGKIKIGIDNPTGHKYAYTLIEAITTKQLPPPTSIDYIQYIECDLTDAQDEVHPLTFIEMSGEVFQKSLYKKKHEMPEKFRKFFFENSNNKHILLAVDYYAAASQRQYFDYILQFCETHGMLETVEGISIIITKWDKRKNVQESPRDFLENNYLGLKNLCEQYAEEYDLSFNVFTFSLGAFTFNPSTGKETVYAFDGVYAKKIYDLLCTTSIKKNKKKKKKKKTGIGPWWTKLMGGR